LVHCILMPLNNISICGRKKRTKGGGGSQTLTWHKSLTNVITKGGESQTLTWHKSLANVIAKGGGVKHWPDTSYLQTSSQREGGQTLTWHKSLTNAITKGGVRGSNTDLTQVTYKRHHKGRRSQMLTWHKSLTNIITRGQTLTWHKSLTNVITKGGGSNADLTQVTYKRHHKGRGGQMLTWHKSLTSQKVISSSPQTDKR